MALLVLLGVLPAVGTNAPAGAVFPVDVYFDVKQMLSATSSWPRAFLWLTLACLVRAAVLTTVLTLLDGKEGRFLPTFVPCLRLVAMAAVAFVPINVLFFSGTAIRYAPFLWLAAPVGLVITLLVLRKAIALDAGTGVPPGRGTPELGSFLTYAYVLAASSAALSFLGDRNLLLATLFIASMGPVHGLFFLGWRESARQQIHGHGGRLAVVVSVLLFGAIAAGTFYDRVIRSPAPVGTAPAAGSLLLLGGADSTSKTGALTELDPRDLGYPRGRARLLSYADDSEYEATDTHGDLDATAELVSEQVTSADPPVALVGHSQAALILDRLLDAELSAPDVSVVLAAPPPYPPSVDVPEPGMNAPGKPGGDAARVLAWLLQRAGQPGFDVDAPASPTNLSSVVVLRSSVRRASVWPLADSVWLDRDWRRPDEVNMVAITDHVGVTNNGRALASARDYLAGRTFVSDEASWRSVLVPVVRYVFEPWRPGGEAGAK